MAILEEIILATSETPQQYYESRRQLATVRIVAGLVSVAAIGIFAGIAVWALNNPQEVEQKSLENDYTASVIKSRMRH